MTIFAILLIIAGIFSAATPNFIFYITQSWKNNNDSTPSDLYKNITRIQGIILVIIGIGLILRGK